MSTTGRWARMGVLLAVLVFGFRGSSPAQEAGRQRMTPELLWKLRRVSGAAVSPDGKLVAWKEQQYDLAANSSQSDVLVADWGSGETMVVARGWKSVGDLQWTGTGDQRRLWFVGQVTATEPAAPQVFCVHPGPPDGPAPRRISNFADGAANLRVSPDGKRLAFTVDVRLDQSVNELYADLPKADARIIDGLMYRHWDSWHDFSYSHLHVASIGEDGMAGEPVDLMPEARLDCPLPPFGGNEQIAWAPDSRRIAWTTKIAEHPAESTDSSVWVTDVEHPAQRRDVSAGRPGYDNNPFWSLDGTKLGWHAMERPGFEADRNRVMVLELGSGAVTEWTAGLDQNANGAMFTADGRGLIFTSEKEGTEQIFRMRPGEQPQQLTAGNFNWSLVGEISGGNQLVVMRQSMLRPDEVFVLNLVDGFADPLSHANDNIYESLELPTVVARRIPASDGKTIHAWVVLPPGFDAAADRKWPLLLFCQGGPQSQVGQGFSFRWNFHLMGAMDYVVIAPNRRGLPGFGQAWNDEISGDWGGQAMRDLLAATDDISREPWIDTSRRAAIGASFGGYSVYWLMGNHAGRFAAMIAHCGVFNLESMYGGTEELFFVNWDIGGPYWRSEEVAQRYASFSPHRFVKNWDTPLLVIHGEKDFRVPVGQGMEAFTAAQVQRIPSRFLYFPEEGHWVMRPQNSVLWQRVFFDWLQRHCGPK